MIKRDCFSNVPTVSPCTQNMKSLLFRVNEMICRSPRNHHVYTSVPFCTFNDFISVVYCAICLCGSFYHLAATLLIGISSMVGQLIPMGYCGNSIIRTLLIWQTGNRNSNHSTNSGFTDLSYEVIINGHYVWIMDESPMFTFSSVVVSQSCNITVRLTVPVFVQTSAMLQGFNLSVWSLHVLTLSTWVSS